MGTIFTTADGQALKQVPSGDVQIDFLHGTIQDAAGTTTQMNTNLDYYGLTQCQSFAVYASDADTEINFGNSLSVSDHQLTHVVNNYAFDSVRLTIPTNATPDATNQVIFVGSTDPYLGYVFNNYAHDRDELGITTSTNTFTTYVSYHVGGYDQVLFTVYNTHAANSLNVKVQFSENGSDWFDDVNYTAATGVTVAGLSYDAYASSIPHHFRRVQVQSTVAGNHATFNIFWNYVSANN